MANKSLETLLRLNRWAVDEKQKALRVLLDREDEIRAQIEAHTQALAKERQVATEDTMGIGGLFLHYYNAWEIQRDQLNKMLADMQVQVDEAREDLAESFRALKSAEEVKKQRDAAEALEESRKETAAMDEIGLNQFLKRQE